MAKVKGTTKLIDNHNKQQFLGDKTCPVYCFIFSYKESTSRHIVSNCETCSVTSIGETEVSNMN